MEARIQRAVEIVAEYVFETSLELTPVHAANLLNHTDDDIVQHMPGDAIVLAADELPSAEDNINVRFANIT